MAPLLAILGIGVVFSVAYLVTHASARARAASWLAAARAPTASAATCTS